MRAKAIILAVLAIGASLGSAEPTSQPTSRPGEPAVKAYVIVPDFGGDAKRGPALADSIRLKLRRVKGFWVLDRLSTQEFTGPVDPQTPPHKLAREMADRWGVNVAVYGTVVADGDGAKAVAIVMDLRDPKHPRRTRLELADATERWRGVLATKIVEHVTGQPAWRPPEYGDEPEPETLGQPLNRNGDFSDQAGWDAPDNVSTFFQRVKDPGHGLVLRVRTDLKREPWLAYRRALMLGRADPSKPPTIGRDTTYGSVAGLEGVHFASEMLPAKAGQRYWLTVDCKPTTAKVDPESMFFPKVFVKGFARTAHAMDGLSETALAEMGLSPEQFAELPETKRRQLIQADARKHPLRYVRECYRWYLSCRATPGEWNHFAAPFPPRGGLGDNVDFLQIQVYSYWPPGEYLWDNVHLYADPRQKAPLPEAKPRTPNFGKTSDVVERATSQPASRGQ